MSDLPFTAEDDEIDFIESDFSDTDLTKTDAIYSDSADSDFAVRPALQVFKKDGELCRRLLDHFGLSDPSFRPFAKDEFLFLPLLKNNVSKLHNQIVDFDFFLTKASFKRQKKTPTVLDILGYSVAYEMIGDIAVIDDKPDAEDKNVSDVAAAILKVHPSIQTVLLSAGPISGEFRTRPLEFIAGVNKTATVHKEYGCQYHVDLAHAYFTPRLSTERHRILTQIQGGAVVIDMFAGVGPYSIMIAKHASPKCVVANDKNEAAVELLKKNIVLNKVLNVTALNEDAMVLPDQYAGAGDHIIMNLPQNAAAFLDTAVSLCKKGGIIHYYAIANEDDLFAGSIELIREAAEKQKRTIDVIEMKNVRSYAPHQYNICLDVRII
ncbi:MAG: class I SAM-dependent methyltransferase family protein [Methanimicrococcus sp.]|nr:class I SAM-dependent methyltransferase family protein [Methanimicrococcus sp.]